MNYYPSTPGFPKKEEESLIALSQIGDLRARELLLMSVVRVLIKVAHSVSVTNNHIADDICQDLLEYVIKYMCVIEPRTTSRFLSYFPRNVFFSLAMKMKLRYQRLHADSERTQVNILTYRQVRKAFIVEYGRPPRYDEIAKCMGIDTERIREIRHIDRVWISLEHCDGLQKIHEEINPQWIYRPRMVQESPDPFRFVHDDMKRDDVCSVLRADLTRKEEMVIVFHYGLGDKESMTLKEIGKILNVTRERVRQIEKRALKKLRYSSLAYKLLKCYHDGD